jgi:hypothetical protein
MRVVYLIVGILIALIVLVWVGLRVKPAPLADFPQQSGEVEMVPLPENLPQPVERFYRQQYGAEIPVIDSFVITGRARMRIMGITFPARYRFTHLAGAGYRHYIETTFFGLPIMRVNERYLEGTGIMELPFGIEKGPQIDQGANLGLWAETLWLSPVYLTDPRVRWEAVDEETALLFVPFGDEEQQFVARFDPDSGRVEILEAMRYRGTESSEKTLWINQAVTWAEVDGYPTAEVSTATWLDDGQPWAEFMIEDLRVNVDVSDYIQAKGP